MDKRKFEQYMGFLSLPILLVWLMGVIHAFGQSIGLGIASVIGGKVTIVIEILSWFSKYQLWEEMNKWLGL